jgi:RNA polymerase sigma factor (sigma-70 family)
MQLETLFQEHHDGLFRYLARFTGDPDLSDDLVQETFLRLASKPPSEEDHVKAWLFRVATNLALDSLRGRGRRAALVRAAGDRVPRPQSEPDPLDSVERNDVRVRVRQALNSLTDKERTVLLMREEGFKHREIAEAVGTSTGSVGTMIARALEKLARRLDLGEESAR